MNPVSLNIKVRIDIYEARLRNEIGSDLSVLENTLETLSNPQNNKRSIAVRGGFTVAQISVPPTEVVKQREINKCFKSIIGSLQDYMDNLIAVLSLKNETVSLPPRITQSDLDKILNDLLANKLLEVSADRSLNIPEKLKLLLDKSDHAVLKESLQSYFDVRNGLKHHKGLAKENRILKYKRMGLASSLGHKLSLPSEPGEGLMLKGFDEEIKYDKGGQLIISKTQLDSLIINLLIFAIPQIQQSIAEKIWGGKQPPVEKG